MPEPPYYAVIFTSLRKPIPGDGYAEAAARMEELARIQPGFVGLESARGDDGVGITVSYWDSLDAVAAWGRQAEHVMVQALGRAKWYESYALRVCRVEAERAFTRPTASGTTEITSE